MSSHRTPITFQARRPSDYETVGDDVTRIDMENYRHSQNTPLLRSTPLHTENNQCSDPHFPYHHDMQADLRMDVPSDAYILSGPEPSPDYRRSITSLPAAPPASSSSVVGGQDGNTSGSGGSEDASPASNRAGGGIDGAYRDDSGFGTGMPIDGSELDDKSREDKNDPIPPWSELKTKAGKERKRLPLACIACRRKKIRCSGEKPACTHCLRSRIPCVYKVTTRKAAPRTDYMAMLDKRLRRMEDRIIKVVPKEEQHNTASVTRANVKPATPGTTAARNPTTKKRGADEAFGQEIDNWSKTASNSNGDDTSMPSSLMRQEAGESQLFLEGAQALPPKDIQEHLAEVFFDNVYGQAYHLLHKPSYTRKLKAGTLPPVLILAVCAVSARFSTHPKVSTTPAFLRGEEWASEVRDIVTRRYEWPNITILTCLLILSLHEFGTCHGGRSWALGGQAIRMAYALQLQKDLDYDPYNRGGPSPLSFIDREIRRRVMWACFLMDRFESSGTDRATFIKEQDMKIPLPIKEKNFQLDMPGSTENLKGEVPNPMSPSTGQLADPKENMGVAAHMIRAIALWGRIINYLNLGGKEEDPHPMWHPESFYMDLLRQADTFHTTLPPALDYSLENLRTHETGGLANQFLFLHIIAQQNILFMGRFAVPGRDDVPKDFVTKSGGKAIGAANRISDLIRDGEPYFVTAPFAGYCAFLSSTVHIFGVFSNNTALEAVAKQNLATNFKYLAKMKRYWGMFHHLSESLKNTYRACADASGSGSKPSEQIIQYGDWFDQYPNGVSHSDFEDPAVVVREEKGDDAVLEHKSDYHTVEEFFHTIASTQAQERKSGKAPKRKGKMNPSLRQEPPAPINTNTQLPSSQALSTQNEHQIPHTYNQMSPTTTAILYNQQPSYDHDDLLPPHQQNILSQLDRQLVFGAYAGMDPSTMAPPVGFITNDWNMQPNGMMGFETEPSSAWFMPFNMQPPEFGDEAVIFNTIGGVEAAYGIQGDGMVGN